MKSIPIQPAPAGVTLATRYQADQYPGVGIYQQGDDLCIVAPPTSEGTWPYVIVIQAGASMATPAAPASPAAPPPATQTTGVSELTLLRAIALIQQPDLIKTMQP